MHVFVYQEWDMMREKTTAPEERLEKTQPIPARNVSFASQLQEARISHRMTIGDLASKCGVPSRTMSMYENGSEMPPSDVSARIKQVLSIE